MDEFQVMATSTTAGPNDYWKVVRCTPGRMEDVAGVKGMEAAHLLAAFYNKAKDYVIHWSYPRSAPTTFGSQDTIRLHDTEGKANIE